MYYFIKGKVTLETPDKEVASMARQGNSRLRRGLVRVVRMKITRWQSNVIFVTPPRLTHNR